MSRWNDKYRTERGFGAHNIFEPLVVVSIVGIMLAVIVPQYLEYKARAELKGHLLTWSETLRFFGIGPLIVFAFWAFINLLGLCLEATGRAVTMCRHCLSRPKARLRILRRPASSDSLVLFPTVACLEQIRDYLHTTLRFIGCNQKQAYLIDLFGLNTNTSWRSVFGSQLVSIASQSIDEVNRFLKKHGFTVQFPEGTPGDFAVASVLQIVVEWLHPGTACEIETSIGKVSGLQITDSFNSYTCKSHPHPILKLLTRSGTQIFVTVWDKPIDSDLTLSKRLAQTVEDLSPHFGFSGVRLPMINYNEIVDVSWLEGLNVIGEGVGSYCVARAIAEVKFQLNEHGAVAKAVAALTFVCTGAALPLYVIDRPFLLWMMEPGVPHPTFIGYFCEESWSDPGDIFLSRRASIAPASSVDVNLPQT